jgi:Flp pilus assembly pilin Flp
MYSMATAQFPSEPLKPSQNLMAEDAPALADKRGVNEQSEAPGGSFLAQRGQSLFEYALIILFVALAVVVGLALIAPSLNHIFNQVPNAF